jgi:small subunit ribosomal protein S4
MTDRCSFDRRSHAPGQHGQKKGKLSEFGQQLREKQKVKRVYGMQERQFRLTFQKAVKQRGVTSDLFFRRLELRLDNVLFRMGFARSRNEARQLVRHSHVMVNGRRSNIPSHTLALGDVVTIANKSQKAALFTLASELHSKRAQVPWVNVDHTKFEGKIVAEPQRDDLQLNVKERLIVELYSK